MSGDFIAASTGPACTTGRHGARVVGKSPRNTADRRGDHTAPATDTPAPDLRHTCSCLQRRLTQGRLSVATRTFWDMTGVGVRWNAEQVLALAPGTASRRAGCKLSTPAPWSAAGTGRGAVWGQCKESGRAPYRAAVDTGRGDGPGYRCSCPSRTFPCEHALGLLLRATEQQQALTNESVPPEWFGVRRERRTGKPPPAAGGAEDGGSPDTDEGSGCTGAGRSTARTRLPGSARRRDPPNWSSASPTCCTTVWRARARTGPRGARGRRSPTG